MLIIFFHNKQLSNHILPGGCKRPVILRKYLPSTIALKDRNGFLVHHDSIYDFQSLPFFLVVCQYPNSFTVTVFPLSVSLQEHVRSHGERRRPSLCRPCWRSSSPAHKRQRNMMPFSFKTLISDWLKLLGSSNVLEKYSSNIS